MNMGERSCIPRCDLVYVYIDCLNVFLSGLSLPMFLSGFSHVEAWHLACNMIVLWSFSPVIHGTDKWFLLRLF
jgi:hypothetical protein